MPQPNVRPPDQRHRRWLSPAALARRFAYLDAIDRRCDAMDRKCIGQVAKVEFEVRDVDPATGKPTGDVYTVKSCTRHRRMFEDAPSRYVLISVRELPPGVPLTKAQRDRLLTDAADTSTDDADPGQG